MTFEGQHALELALNHQEKTKHSFEKITIPDVKQA